MSPRLPPPLDQIADLPVDVVAALRALPVLVEHTEEMRRNTAVLREVADGVKGVARDTEALPALRGEMERVAGSTRYIEPMDERMAAIEGAMPVLVEVQRHLAHLPETMERLEDRIGDLTDLLQRMLGALGSLDESVTSLRAAVEPLGRVADRLPGAARRA